MQDPNLKVISAELMISANPPQPEASVQDTLDVKDIPAELQDTLDVKDIYSC